MHTVSLLKIQHLLIFVRFHSKSSKFRQGCSNWGTVSQIIPITVSNACNLAPDRESVEMAAEQSSKRQKLTDFFVKLPTDATIKPREIPKPFRQYQPTKVPCHPAWPKHSFGCPRKMAPTPDTSDNLHEPCPVVATQFWQRGRMQTWLKTNTSTYSALLLSGKEFCNFASNFPPRHIWNQ